ncbi:WhiB family transcriptional regulator [Streptomyces sp. H23]|uniref:WhiB family transcriptional regulator n=1 Tax=Streptomyces sp. H23 TaxID=2541723 RepID=UPI00106E0C28|nr:WhiB family transcriptional regulator [Streptomyces sp. H23]
MSRTGATDSPMKPDPRFPFPHSPTPTRCQTNPALFDFARGDRTGPTRAAAEKQLERARQACSGCPIVKDCLRWALVNKPLTKVGIYAATTPGQRTELRKRMAERLGPDWIDVLAAQDQVRRERAAAARHTPLTVSQTRIVRLDVEVNGPMRLPLSPSQQRRNLARLMAGLKAA